MLAGLTTRSRVLAAADGTLLKAGFAEADITPEIGM